MHEMQTIAISDRGHRQSVLYKSVCLSCSFTQLYCESMAEHIEVLLGMETHGDPGNIVLDVSPNFPHRFDVAFFKLL